MNLRKVLQTLLLLLATLSFAACNDAELPEYKPTRNQWTNPNGSGLSINTPPQNNDMQLLQTWSPGYSLGNAYWSLQPKN